MKYIFIINPKAGRKDNESDIIDRLSAYKGSADYEIYKTSAPNDATEYIRKYCKSHSDDTCFVACGGDGTLNEVVNGVMGFSNAYVSIFACGSGNDFVKYYGGVNKFLDVEAIFEGSIHKIDAIKVEDKYSINIVNFGFDTCVAKTMAEVKRKPIIGGKNAYNTGIVKALFTAMRNECTVKIDGKPLNDGEILLCTLSNGQYVGGAFRCAPRAVVDDGLLEVCLVEPVSRFTFLKLVKLYTIGEHIDNPLFKGFLKYCRCKEVEVIAPKGFCVTLDGETMENNHFTASVVPGALNFIVPKGACPIVEDGFKKQYFKETLGKTY